MTLVSPSALSYIYLSLERGEGREPERGRDIEGLPPAHAPSGDGTRKPGLCLTWN